MEVFQGVSMRPGFVNVGAPGLWMASARVEARSVSLGRWNGHRSMSTGSALQRSAWIGRDGGRTLSKNKIVQPVGANWRRHMVEMQAAADAAGSLYRAAIDKQIPMNLSDEQLNVSEQKDATAFQGDALVVGLHEPADADTALTLSGVALEWDGKLEGAISGLIEDEAFRGRAGSSVSVRILSKGGIKHLVIVGLGKQSDPEKNDDESSPKPVSYKGMFSSALATAKGSKSIKSIGMLLPENAQWDAKSFTDAVEVLSQGLYKDERFQGSLTKEEKEKAGMKDEQLPEFVFLGSSEGGDVLQASLRRGMGLYRAVSVAKQLVVAPPNVVTPVSLAESATKIASKYSDTLSIEVLDRDECERLGMGSYLAVARGSVYPPKFIHFTYRPKGEVKKKLAFVGKGLTFDSGGYNIKTQMMEKMKFDMGGSAAVLGAAVALGELQPSNVEVHLIVAACENMVDSTAYRPGDVITASNGVTIEVLNTDAEGRLTLADALVFAENLGNIDAIVEMSTLTGAIMGALGNQYAGLFTTSDKFAERVSKCAKDAGEKMWRMPMPEEYNDALKSKVADLQNIGSSPRGGAITAALFLQRFVKKAPFAHIDIAGTAWDWTASAASGYGVKTFLSLTEDYSKETD